MAWPEDGRPLMYKLTEPGQSLLRQAFHEKGWIELEENGDEDKWHVSWKSQRFFRSEYDSVRPHQKLNHFPRSGIITRKDTLLRELRKMKAVHGAIYAFFPEGYLVPSEYTKFVTEHSRQEKKAIWICKPTDSSRGRKIFLIRELTDLLYDKPYIVQKYVDRPFLIGGYKFDLRLYSLVVSVHPLVVYLYREGLVRFSTAKYHSDPEACDISNIYSHLTNSTINKHSPTVVEDKDVIGPGCKWSLSQFEAWVNQAFPNGRGQDMYQALWQRMINIINLTCLMLLSSVPTGTEACFELLGYDIIVDSDWSPILLEVNCSPAITKDCDIDEKVKLPLLKDILDIVGPVAPSSQSISTSTNNCPPAAARSHHRPHPTQHLPRTQQSVSTRAKTGSPIVTEKPSIGKGHHSRGPITSALSPDPSGATTSSSPPHPMSSLGGFDKIFPRTPEQEEASQRVSSLYHSRAFPMSKFIQGEVRGIVAQIRNEEKRLREMVKAIGRCGDKDNKSSPAQCPPPPLHHARGSGVHAVRSQRSVNHSAVAAAALKPSTAGGKGGPVVVAAAAAAWPQGAGKGKGGVHGCGHSDESRRKPPQE